MFVKEILKKSLEESLNGMYGVTPDGILGGVSKIVLEALPEEIHGKPDHR